MATITSVGSGAWSASGTWDSGVPVDGDDVVISAGHTVTFDADQSAFTTGVKITITGTLNHALTGGPYTMFIKTGASVTGTGTWNVGTEANPIPFAVKHTITGATAWYATGASGLTMTVYGAEPTTKYVKLSGDEAIGQTELSVDTDVSADIWADGDTVRICDINQSAESETRVIAVGGIAAGTITVTDGLTAVKSTGAYIALITRNINIISSGATYGACYQFSSGKLTIAGGQWTTGTNCRMFNGCTFNISGGVFHGASGSTPLAYACTNSVIAGGVFNNNYTFSMTDGVAISDGLFIGNAAPAYLCKGFTVSGGLFAGNIYALAYQSTGFTITGGTLCNSTQAIGSSAGFDIFGGTLSANSHGIYNSSATIKNAVFVDNTNDINYSVVSLFNTAFGAGTEVANYTSLSPSIYSESYDHNQVAGAYKAWTKGGITTKQATVYPDGFDESMQTVLESATNEGYWQKEVTVGAGQSVNITSYLRKDASMSYLPRVIIFNKAEADPFAGGAGIHTFTMTDAIDTWEDDTYTYSNDTSDDVVLVIRTQGKNATGNLFSYLDIEVINVDLTSALALLNSIKAKTNLIPANPAVADEYNAALTAIQADLDNPAQYKADVSGLATTAHVQEVENKIDAIDVTVNTIPTTPLLAANYTAPDNASIAAILEDTGTTIPATLAGLATSAEVGAITMLDEVVVGSYTMQDILKILAAKMVGKATGGGTTTITYRGLDDTSDVIIETVDSNGNRSAVTLTV